MAREAWARQDIAALQHGIGTRADVRLEAGQPERTVAAAARRIRADLVVIGKSGTFWLPRRLRTRPYDIVCEAPCPVAIYYEPGYRSFRGNALFSIKLFAIVGTVPVGFVNQWPDKLAVITAGSLLATLGVGRGWLDHPQSKRHLACRN